MLVLSFGLTVVRDESEEDQDHACSHSTGPKEALHSRVHSVYRNVGPCCPEDLRTLEQ